MTLDPDVIVRDNVVQGDSGSGDFDPIKSQFRQWMKALSRISGGNSINVATLAELNAITGSSNQGGFVWGDSTAANNGVYHWDATSSPAAWEKLAGLPHTAAVLTNIGGTANAITADTETGVDPAEVKMLVLTDPPATNTSNTVTIALNGGAAESIKAASGSGVAIGDLIDGVGTLLFRVGSEWRQLFSSQTGATMDFQGAWDSGTTNTRSQFVTKSNKLFFLDAASSLNDDPESGAPWVEVVDFSDLITKTFEEDDAHSLIRIRSMRDGSSYYSSAIVFDAPRSDTADGSYQTGRAMILAQANDDSTTSSLWLFGNSASLVAASDDTTLRGYQSSLEVDSGGKIRCWSLGSEYFRVDKTGYVLLPNGALLDGTSASALYLRRTNATGTSDILIDPVPEATSVAGVYMFRAANTTGDVRLRGYRGDGSSSDPIFQFSRDNNNYVCALDGDGGTSAKEGPNFTVGAEGSINQYKLLVSRVDFDTTDSDAVKNHLVEFAADGDHGVHLGPIVDLIRGGNPSNALTTDVNAPGSTHALGALRFTGRTADYSAVRYFGIEAIIVSASNSAYEGKVLFKTANSGTYSTRMTLQQGLKIGTPAGDDKGYGSLNALAVYDDNTLLTCIPLQKEFLLHGRVDLLKWDEISPTGHHTVAHLFNDMLNDNFDPRDTGAYFAKVRKDGALPGMPTFEDWKHSELSSGEMISRLWLAVELLAVATMTDYEERKAA